MPSIALQEWRSDRSAALEEIEQAHAAVGGTGRGRRYATQQINRAYAVLLASQFQGFCRDLHSECVDHVVLAIDNTSIQAVMRAELTRGRQLDRGNAQPASIGSDFGRLGIGLWDEFEAADRSNARRRAALDKLNSWRNAIVHQDFDPAKLDGRTTLQLSSVRRWRAECDQLADALDRLLRNHLHVLTAQWPW